MLFFSKYLETESNAVLKVKSKKVVQTIVTVIERVDAEKDQDEDGHQEQRIVDSGHNGIVIPGVEGGITLVE